MADKILIIESTMQYREIWFEVKEELNNLGYDVELINPKKYYNFGLVDLEASEIEIGLRGMFPFEPSINRFYISKSKDHNLTELYYRRYLTYWVKRIQNEKIVLVIAPVAPHRIFDVSLYEACKLESIKYVSITHSVIKTRFLIDDYIRTDSGLYKNIKNIEKNIDDELLNIICKCRGEYNLAIPKYEKNNIKEARLFYLNKIKKIKKLNKFWTNLKNTNHIINGGGLNAFQFVSYQFRKELELKFLKIKYNRLTKKVDLFKTKYVYFPLMYQPEETSYPTGGYFNNQLLIADMLTSTLNKDTKIVIKEHPSQFNRALYGDLARLPSFYNALASNKNIIFCPMSYNQFDLIDNSEMVATISGTAGFEAYCRGKKVTHFGKSWFSGVSNCHFFETIDGLKKFMEQPVTQLSADNIYDELKNILIYGVDTVCDESDEKIYGKPTGTDVHNLKEVLLDYVKKNNK